MVLRSAQPFDRRVLIMAPTGRDGALVLSTLARASIDGLNCRSQEEFLAEMRRGAAAAVLADEALIPSMLASIIQLLEAQPPWSDFPFITIAAGGQTSDVSARRFAILKPLGNYTLLERPFHPETLLTVIQSALRARRRQYQVRDYLAEREQLAAELERKVDERTKELVASQHALSQAQRLEAIGRLAGGVAHDFNNLMTGILGLADEIATSLGENHPHYEDLLEVTKAAQKAAQLTRQLLAFGRRQAASPTALDANHMVTDMVKIFERLVGEHIELVTYLEPGLPPIQMDASQFEQVLMNLVLNARDAMPKGGRITIETKRFVPNMAAGQSSGLPKEAVSIEISDTGVGMSTDTLDHVFEPFFTTKEIGKGFGLGLATVYGIVKQHGGDISAESLLGEGSTFTLYLPVSTAPIAPQKSAQGPLLKGSETVLVVEDESIVRNVAVRALRRAGYNVFEASSPVEAIKLVESLESPLDLLLTDMVMPGMNGRELAERLECEKRGVAVLYMSGHTDDVITRQGILLPGIAFLGKTFGSAELCAKVREVLDARSTHPALGQGEI